MCVRINVVLLLVFRAVGQLVFSSYKLELASSCSNHSDLNDGDRLKRCVMCVCVRSGIQHYFFTDDPTPLVCL